MNILLILYVLASLFFLAPSYAAESGSAMAQLGGFNPGQDFPMPETPSVPQMPLPFMPPSDPHPFFTGTCMVYCPWGFDNRPGAGSCTCYDPFAGSGVGCQLACEAGLTPEPACDCGPLHWANSPRGKLPDKAVGGAGKFVADLLEGASTATVTCGGVEYSIFAFPMNCGMENSIPSDWLETGAAYYAYKTALARQPRLKEQVLEHLNGTGNAVAAAAVAERSSRIFSDGAVLFVATDGKIAEIADGIAARRVYENTFSLTASEKAHRGMGVHKDVVRSVLACMASDACWGGAAGGRD